eukprot:gene31409-6575_t
MPKPSSSSVDGKDSPSASGLPFSPIKTISPAKASQAAVQAELQELSHIPLPEDEPSTGGQTGPASQAIEANEEDHGPGSRGTYCSALIFIVVFFMGICMITGGATYLAVCKESPLLPVPAFVASRWPLKGASTQLCKNVNAGLASGWEQMGVWQEAATPYVEAGGLVVAGRLEKGQEGARRLVEKCGPDTLAEITSPEGGSNSKSKRAKKIRSKSNTTEETLQYSFRTMLDASKLRHIFPHAYRWTQLVKDLYEANMCGAAAGALRSGMGHAPQCFLHLRGHIYKGAQDGGQLLTVDLLQQLEVCHKSVIVVSSLPKMSASALWALQQLTSEPGQISIGGHAVPGFKALVVVMAEVADLVEVQEMAEFDVEVVRQLRTAVEESKGGAEKAEAVMSMLKNVDFVAPILDHDNS